MRDVITVIGIICASAVFFMAGLNYQKNKPQRVWVHFESVHSKQPNGMEYSDYLKDGKMSFEIMETGLKCTVNVMTYER